MASSRLDSSTHHSSRYTTQAPEGGSFASACLLHDLTTDTQERDCSEAEQAHTAKHCLRQYCIVEPTHTSGACNRRALHNTAKHCLE